MGQVVPLRSVTESPPDGSSHRRGRGSRNRIKLTETRIEALPLPAAGAAYTYDTEQPGLAVRVTSAGARTFVLVKSMSGRTTRITLGAYPALRLDRARQAVRRLVGDAAAGVDVVAERKAARLKGATCADLWAAYERYITSKKENRTAGRDKRRWEAELRDAIGNRAVGDVTRAELQAIVDRIGKKAPIAANRVASLLRAMMGFAAKREIIATNPAVGLDRYQETIRDRVLRGDEVGRLVDAIHAEGEPWSDLFMMLLLTGQRRGAVMSMRWQDVDLDGAVWVIPAETAKNGAATPIALVDDAVSILRRRLKKRANEPWVFPAASRSGHIETPTKAWARVTARGGLEDLHLHDLRRSVGTWLAAGGASAHAIQKALGHKSLAAAKHYVHLDVEAVRADLARAVGVVTGRRG